MSCKHKSRLEEIKCKYWELFKKTICKVKSMCLTVCSNCMSTTLTRLGKYIHPIIQISAKAVMLQSYSSHMMCLSDRKGILSITQFSSPEDESKPERFCNLLKFTEVNSSLDETHDSQLTPSSGAQE